MDRRAARRDILRLTGAQDAIGRTDTLAVEEPLEIRVDGSSLTVTMRTPGDDVDLVLGFLVAEGIIRTREDVVGAAYCAGATSDGVNTYNVLDVRLTDTAAPNAAARSRQVLTTSACGLCGRTSIDDVRTASPYDLCTDSFSVDRAWIFGLPDRLRQAQAVFESTGGLHAAGLFDVETGDLLAAREDVGRHNAVDKVIGWALREDRLPAAGTVLMVSGRASFELVQKAVVAGIPGLCAVSAPSSLAVDLAVESGLTLVGFLRGETMNVYAGAERIGRRPAAVPG